MSKELVISASSHETRVAILEDGQLCEIYIEREKEFALVGSIYKGRVTRVLPGMQSAFVDIGRDSDAFLYVSDFFENLEEYDHIVSTVEGKVEKMEQQGGEVFSPPAPGASESRAIFEPPDVSPRPSTPAVEETGPTAPPEQVAPGPVSAPPYRSDRDRGHGGFGHGRGDRGGRGRRWGRRGGRGDRRRGRDLPPSKYASHRPYRPPTDVPPPDPGYEPIILPGESLAKYKDRIPATPSVPDQAGPPEGSATLAPAPVEEHSPSLPENLYAGEPPAGAPGDQTSSVPAQPAELHEELLTAAEHAPLTDERSASEPALVNSEETPAIEDETAHDLSEAEVHTLSQEFAEMKQEPGEGTEETSGERHTFEEAPEEHDEVHAEGEDQPAFEAGEESEEQPSEEEENAEARDSSEEEQPQPTAVRVEQRPGARFQRPMRRGGRRGGGRPHRHHDRHAAQRRPQMISEMLKAGQEIIVQIAKEPLGKKGARITSHVALPGRYLVYMPTVDHIGVSRKINSAETRAHLRQVVSEAKAGFPGGFIVRTAAQNATDDDIRDDVQFLGRTWGDIRSRAEQRKAPALLHRDLNLVERILRDYLSQDYSSIWIDNEEEYSKVVEFVSRFQPRLVGRVKLYVKETPIFEEFGIQQELDKALRPKVWLKSGGYIVINHTEALVAIDVNTGKYVGRGSTRLEDTIVKTNLEAVKEIVRQIRLRDLGGIIVVDFIDMEERRNRDKVMHALDDALRDDRAPSKALSFNEFGLVAITRKRTKQALERVLCQPCPYCTGSGMVKSVPTICYEIQSEARKMAGDLDHPSITLRVNPEIAKALKTRESNLMEELEQATRKSIIIQADPTLHWEQYDIY